MKKKKVCVYLNKMKLHQLYPKEIHIRRSME